ncbi:hypothetical protein ACFSR9_00190 [Deinococcus taklimakanensis]|uniref:Uncharacterized protein n=1 Tax=Deinococcus taklimakanensis TaxID=536443 RepID=A0ABW5NY78_9DEIO
MKDFLEHYQLYHGEAPNERRRLDYLRGLARDLELPVVAAPEVCMAEAEDYPLLDALTCARLGIDVNTPHEDRPRNDARHVRSPDEWGSLLPFPDALLNASNLAESCALDLLPERLHSPEPRLKPHETPQLVLEEKAFAGLDVRYAPDRRPTALEGVTTRMGPGCTLRLRKRSSMQ